jgi:hypothetical protein
MFKDSVMVGSKNSTRVVFDLSRKETITDLVCERFNRNGPISLLKFLFLFFGE